MKTVFSIALLAACLGLTACSRTNEPVRIGFIGGLSDRNSDTGQSGLNGVQLAIAEANRTGGINGRTIELVVKDDAQNKETAAAAAQALVDARVEAVIGPFTSGMAEVIVPILGAAGIFEVSPTITSMAFFGKDDNLFRINRTTRDNAQDYAKFMVKSGQRRVAVAYDLRNRNFTESWLNEFRTAMRAEGGDVIVAVSYESAPDTDFREIIGKMWRETPDGLFFISGAVDVAQLAREARAQSPGVPIGASEWAATEQLASLGGEVLNGLLIIQNFDRQDRSPRFLQFVDTYQQHFQRFPGYPAVTAYDAAKVTLSALRQRRSDETVKTAALRSGPYAGLQQDIHFDANGDTSRRVVFTKIQNGSFVSVTP